MTNKGARQRAALALALLPGALLAIGLLSVRDFSTTTVPSSILNGMVEASAIVVLIGLLGVLLPSRFARPWCFTAAVASLLICLAVAWAGAYRFFTGSGTLATLAWAGLAGTGTALSALIAFLIVTRSRWQTGPVKAYIPAVLAPALLLSSLQFWHGATYLPSQLEAVAAIDVSRDYSWPEDGDRQGAIETVLSNEGETATLILISSLLVCPRESASVTQGATLDDPDCRQQDRPFGERSFLPEQSRLENQQIFSWETEHAVVETQVRIAYARDDRLKLGLPMESPPLPCMDQAVPILSTSRVHALVGPQRLLAYGPGPQGGTTYWVTDRSRPNCDRDMELLVRLGIRELRVHHQDWLPEQADSEEPRVEVTS
jgi:hypothetical protein